jgi:hypothetical protein
VRGRAVVCVFVCVSIEITSLEAALVIKIEGISDINLLPKAEDQRESHTDVSRFQGRGDGTGRGNCGA